MTTQKHGQVLADLIYWEQEHGKVKTASQVLAALEAVLLFHSGGLWTSKQTTDWNRLLTYIYREQTIDNTTATTKVLCDAVRHVLQTIETVKQTTNRDEP